MTPESLTTLRCHLRGHFSPSTGSETCTHISDSHGARPAGSRMDSCGMEGNSPIAEGRRGGRSVCCELRHRSARLQRFCRSPAGCHRALRGRVGTSSARAPCGACPNARAPSRCARATAIWRSSADGPIPQTPSAPSRGPSSSIDSWRPTPSNQRTSTICPRTKEVVWRPSTAPPRYKRLQDLKGKYDPHNLFRMNANIAPSS